MSLHAGSFRDSPPWDRKPHLRSTFVALGVLIFRSVLRGWNGAETISFLLFIGNAADARAATLVTVPPGI